MEILKVKQTQFGYLVNDNMSVPMDQLNSDYQRVQQWIAEGNIPEPEFTEEELALQEEIKKKVQRDKDLQEITVTTSLGNTFDGRDKDQTRMLAAIQAAEILGLTETQWKLSNGETITVGIQELKEAQALSIMRIGEIILGG